jgi:hypothetical protein
MIIRGKELDPWADGGLVTQGGEEILLPMPAVQFPM